MRDFTTNPYHHLEELPLVVMKRNVPHLYIQDFSEVATKTLAKKVIKMHIENIVKKKNK